MPHPPGSPQAMNPRGEDWIARRFEELERKESSDIASMNAAALATSNALSAQLATLTAQQATLTATVGTLTTAVADIAALVGKQIVPDFGFATTSNYALPAGQASRVTRASFTLTVPAGFTRALISATAQDTGTNSTAGFDYLFSYVVIGGSGGAFAYCPSPTVPAGYSSTSLAAQTSLLTGLTGGSTITIASQPYTSTGAWAATPGNSSLISATCLYLR